MGKKKKEYKLIKIEMVAVVDADEVEDIDDIDHYFQDLLGDGKNELVHGVVGATIVAAGHRFGPGKVLDEYPPYDDGETYHSLDKQVYPGRREVYPCRNTTVQELFIRGFLRELAHYCINGNLSSYSTEDIVKNMDQNPFRRKYISPQISGKAKKQCIATAVKYLLKHELVTFTHDKYGNNERFYAISEEWTEKRIYDMAYNIAHEIAVGKKLYQEKHRGSPELS
jgi:hypothetical protein